jgi:hypothetical protein
LKNRAALMPSAGQVKRAAATVEKLRRRQSTRHLPGFIEPRVLGS